MGMDELAEAVGGAAAEADAMDVKTPMAAVQAEWIWWCVGGDESKRGNDVVGGGGAGDGGKPLARPALGSTSLSNKGQCWLPAFRNLVGGLQGMSAPWSGLEAMHVFCIWSLAVRYARRPYS